MYNVNFFHINSINIALFLLVSSYFDFKFFSVFFSNSAKLHVQIKILNFCSPINWLFKSCVGFNKKVYDQNYINGQIKIVDKQSRKYFFNATN